MMEQNNQRVPMQQQQQQNVAADDTAETTTSDAEDNGCPRNHGSAMIPLGDDFEPGSDDVLVGRGKACRTWTGNERFRDLVASRLDDYSAAASKLEKSAIVTSVLYEIRTRSPNGGFIKKDPLTGKWHEVGDFVARERVTQSFRDALHGKYRSSNSSKKKRRNEELKRAKKEAQQQQQQPPLAKKLKAEEEKSLLCDNVLDTHHGSLEGHKRNNFFGTVGAPTSHAQQVRSMNMESAASASPAPAASLSNNNELMASVLLPPSALPRSESQLVQQTGATPHHQHVMMSLQQRIMALQGLDHPPTGSIYFPNNPQGGGVAAGDQQEMQDTSCTYPNSWWSVNASTGSTVPNASSDPDPNSRFVMELTSSSAPAAATASEQHPPQAAMVPTASSHLTNFISSNTSQNYYQSQQGGGSSLLANFATTSPTLLQDPMLPDPMLPDPIRNTVVGYDCVSSSTVDFRSSYLEYEDNPFEPVPIAEDISRRNSKRRENNHT